MKHHRDLNFCKNCDYSCGIGCYYDTDVYASIFHNVRFSEWIDAMYKDKMIKYMPTASNRVTSKKCPYYTEQLLYDCSYEESK